MQMRFYIISASFDFFDIRSVFTVLVLHWPNSQLFHALAHYCGMTFRPCTLNESTILAGD